MRINKYNIAVFFVLLLATFLRFYNFDPRLPFGNDGSRDIAIALEALRRHELPLIGSFSSAGPFVFGPLFYWFIMGSYILLPFAHTAPFILTAITGVLTVVILMICGYLLEGKRLSLLVGLLAATSPQLAARSIMVGQHSFIAICTSLLFLAFILYWQKKKTIFAFLMGIFLGIGLSMHYQSINLLIFFPVLIFVPRLSLKKRILGVSFMFLGFFIPSLPLLLWDSQQGFANIRNILDYLLIGQYRIYVPNSWKLFIFTYLPNYWSFVEGGGKTLVGLILMFFTATIMFFSLYKRKISGLLFTMLVIFSILLLVNKLYQGERSEGYLIYLAPFILLLSSFSLYKAIFFRGDWKTKIVIRSFGLLVFFIALCANFYVAKDYLVQPSPQISVRQTADFLEKKYPNTKFAIYDYYNRSSYESQALSLTLEFRNKISCNGKPLVFVCSSRECLKSRIMITQIGTKAIIDGRYIKDLNKDSKKWVKVNPENMYDDLIGWSKRHELKSSFSLSMYILEKLHLKE